MDFDDVTPMVQNIVIMDSDGKRIAVKYYNDEWYRSSQSTAVCPLVRERSRKHSWVAAGAQSPPKPTSRKNYLRKLIVASNEA